MKYIRKTETVQEDTDEAMCGRLKEMIEVLERLRGQEVELHVMEPLSVWRIRKLLEMELRDKSMIFLLAAKKGR